ncbi:hypothetical protein GQ54DRAFT_336265, partial [Martensiomyces pterosporus]
MAADPPMPLEDPAGPRNSDTGDSAVANTGMVANNQQHGSSAANPVQDSQTEVDISRMAVIRHALASQNLPESALEHQLAALAVKTYKIYNINWLRWAKWARSNSIDPTVYSPNNFARFLYAAKIPISSLKSVRAAVHNTWRHISPDSPPLSENQVINKFFTSSKRTQRIARAQRGIPVKPPTWDVSQVINT